MAGIHDRTRRYLTQETSALAAPIMTSSAMYLSTIP